MATQSPLSLFRFASLKNIERYLASGRSSPWLADLIDVWAIFVRSSLQS